MTQAHSANPLQPVVNSWLKAASENFIAFSETAPHATLPVLSLRKRQKHQSPDNSADFARQQQATRLVLVALTRSVLETTLRDYNPTESYPFYCLSQPQNSLVFSSFILPTPSLLCAENLATLQLSDWQTTNRAERQLRKRTGSFYTSSALARYITARVGGWERITKQGANLTPLPPFPSKEGGEGSSSPDLPGGSRTAPTELSDNPRLPTPLLDPACGAGIFLLSALDLLHENNPDVPPQELLEHQLYGLDLNPDAVDLTRLTLLLRLFEIAGPLNSEVAYILGRQIQAGNTLVGVGGRGWGVGMEKGERGNFVGAVREPPGRLEHSLPQSSVLSPQSLSYRAWEAEFGERQAELRERLANLPIFNEGADGPYLASLAPFDWGAAWPEVFEQGGFGAVVGNPPFVGFNDYSGVEKAYFAQAYPQVYNLKADLFYYFIYRGVELLRPGGVLGYVTSRFWKEAVFAARLREWLTNSTRILAIEDQGIVQLFAEAEVDSCLLFLENSPPGSEYQLEFSFAGEVQKVEQAGLGRAPWAWLRRLPAEDLLRARLEEGSVRLGELAECRTGVQTGLDEIFLVNASTAAKLEPAALRLAIKSGDITAPGQLVWPGQKYLIYLPPNCNLADFPNVATYLEPYRARLERRLRYRKPFPYWELQWPRTPEVFDAPAKLVSPYKAPRNWFAMDSQQLYFSTDVISVVFRDGEATPPSLLGKGAGGLGFFLNFLNSSLSTWQFRSYSKQVGGGQYDYYANPLKKLILPRQADLLAYPRLANKEISQEEIDTLVFELYQLTPEEIALIKKGS